MKKLFFEEFNEKYPGVIDTRFPVFEESKVTEDTVLVKPGDLIVSKHGRIRTVLTVFEGKAIATIPQGFSLINFFDPKLFRLFLVSKEEVEEKMRMFANSRRKHDYSIPHWERDLYGIWKKKDTKRTVPIEEVLAQPNDNLSKWQKLGLMPEVGGKILVWKHVRTPEAHESGSWYGNLGGEYKIGKTNFFMEIMATAGPIGAIKEYGHQGKFVMAAWADRVFIAPDHKPGAFYTPIFTPVAIYKIDSKTTYFDDSFDVDLSLYEGVDVLPLIGR